MTAAPKELLVKWREAMGDKQREAAAGMRMSLRGYQQLEEGTRRIRGWHVLAALAYTFGLDKLDLTDAIRFARSKRQKPEK